MAVQTLAIMLAVEPGDKPPTEFRLFRAGNNETTKGTFVFDAKGSQQVIVAYQRRGTRCFFDWNHASLDPKPMDPKVAMRAAGWFDIEDRGGELWATNITWTKDALEEFEAKRVAYFSPAFSTDKSNRVVDFINCALTNLPATHDIDQLVAAMRTISDRRVDLSTSFSDITQAVGEALNEKYPPNDNGCCNAWLYEVFDDKVVFEYDGALWQQLYKFVDGKASLLGDAIKVKRDYVPLSATNSPPPVGATQSTALNTGDTDMDFESKCKKLEEENKKLEDELKKAKKMAEDAEAEMKKAKKLAEDSEEEAKKASRIVEASRKATGKTEADDVEGALMALSAANEQVKSLSARIETIESEKLTASVDKAIADHKLFPHQREWALSMGKKAFEAYLSSVGDATVGPSTVEHTPDPKVQTDPSKIELSAEERAICLAAGFDPEKALAEKRSQFTGRA